VTILEGQDTSKVVRTLISSSPTIARLTAMVHLERDKEDKMVGRQYVWANPAMRPAGKELPGQCPSCGSIRSLRKVKGGDPKIHKFRCKAQNIDGSDCEKTLAFEAENMTPIKNSDWMSGPWPVYGDVPQQPKQVQVEDEGSQSDQEYLPSD
jgi:hypothetical protein